MDHPCNDARPDSPTDNPNRLGGFADATGRFQPELVLESLMHALTGEQLLDLAVAMAISDVLDEPWHWSGHSAGFLIDYADPRDDRALEGLESEVLASYLTSFLPSDLWTGIDALDAARVVLTDMGSGGADFAEQVTMLCCVLAKQVDANERAERIERQS
ncbi:MAG: hypothetical protein JWM90_187 [Thermoleophilia bacterium]|nr:hypothetical protein [Thermoleophilia bacterium]